jgi:hypothetical protein
MIIIILYVLDVSLYIILIHGLYKQGTACDYGVLLVII